MSKIIAIANQKGGVGKTAVTLNFGLSLARRGKKVCFIDFDPQNNTGSTLFPDFDDDRQFMSGNHKASAMFMFDQIAKAEPQFITDNVAVIGACNRMSVLTQDNIMYFDESLDLIKDNFDIILIDCPPAVGTLQHTALTVSDYLLIVTEAEKQSVKGIEKLINTTRAVRRSMNQNLSICGILINKVERNPPTKDQTIWSNKLIEQYGELVFKHKLFKTVKVTEALAKALPLSEFSKSHAHDFGFSDSFDEFLVRIGEDE